MFSELLQSLQQLLGSWWKVDRIRVAATTGRLLQLSAGDRLLIGQHLLVVRLRSVLERSAAEQPEKSAAIGVEYHLAEFSERTDRFGNGRLDKSASVADEPWRLQIFLPGDSQPPTHRLWIGQAIEEEVLEEDIVVLPPTRFHRRGVEKSSALSAPPR